MELSYDVMEGRDYAQLKDLIWDRSRWRQESKWECMSETSWKQQKTKEGDTICVCVMCIYDSAIPTSIKSCSSLYSFKRHLKSHLIAQLINN